MVKKVKATSLSGFDHFSNVFEDKNDINWIFEKQMFLHTKSNIS